MNSTPAPCLLTIVRHGAHNHYMNTATTTTRTRPRIGGGIILEADPHDTDAELCDHRPHPGTPWTGARTTRTAHGYLGDAPAGTIQTLCVDCGTVLASEPPAATAIPVTPWPRYVR